MTRAQMCLYYIAENMKIQRHISEEGYEYFQQAIKLLGQEPILDKIRTDIAEYKDDKIIHAERNEFIDTVLWIIDKYRIES